MQSVPRVAVRAQSAPRVTQVEVTRTCGHVEMLEVRGDPARSAFLDNARLRMCGACYREAQSEKDRLAVAEGKRCPLEGSERQVGWAQSIRQKRAVEFGNVLHESTAWAKPMVETGAFTPEFAKKRTKVVQQAIADLFSGKVTWTLLDQNGQEFAACSNTARWWIDTREIEPRDLVASLLPQYRWEENPGWQPLFLDEVQPLEDLSAYDIPAAKSSKRPVDPDFDDSPF